MISSLCHVDEEINTRHPIRGVRCRPPAWLAHSLSARIDVHGMCALGVSWLAAQRQLFDGRISHDRRANDRRNVGGPLMAELPFFVLHCWRHRSRLLLWPRGILASLPIADCDARGCVSFLTCDSLGKSKQRD